MARPGTVTGWKLDRSERDQLLKEHTPRYPQVVADHVTLEVGGKDIPQEVKAAIVGRADDDSGIEAMVVTIDGSVERPDGSIYHITWSLEAGRKARESNDVLKERGWKELDHPVPVTLTPARF